MHGVDRDGERRGPPAVPRDRDRPVRGAFAPFVLVAAGPLARAPPRAPMTSHSHGERGMLIGARHLVSDIGSSFDRTAGEAQRRQYTEQIPKAQCPPDATGLTPPPLAETQRAIQPANQWKQPL